MTAPAEPLTDEDLVLLATGGDGPALQALLRRHLPWVFNLAIYMLQGRQDAEDATQEILLKLTTKLSSFRGQAAFRTWAHRVAVNHLLDRRQTQAELSVHDFECFGSFLDQTPDTELHEHGWTAQEQKVLVTEARRACTMGMLLCLDRTQRMTLLLGELLELEDTIAAEVLGITRENFRQRLVRARQELHSFLSGKCGLVDPKNPCRCARKTQGFIRAGVVDPRRLQFVESHTDRVHRESRSRARELTVLQQRASTDLRALYPLFRAKDVVARVHAMVATEEWRDALRGSPSDEQRPSDGADHG